MTFDINQIKIGDRVAVAGNNKPARAYGIVRSIQIYTTHVAYQVEITSLTFKSKSVRKGSCVWMRHSALRRETNEPDMIMKSIL